MARQSYSAKLRTSLDALIKAASDAQLAVSRWHHDRLSDERFVDDASACDQATEAVALLEQLHFRVVVECQTVGEILEQLEPEPAQTGGAR